MSLSLVVLLLAFVLGIANDNEIYSKGYAIIEQSKNITQIKEEDIKEFYIQALKLEPQMLIDYLIKEIKAFDDKIEITFNSPLRTSPDNQGFSFLSKLKQVKHLSVGRSTPKIINVKLEMCI